MRSAECASRSLKYYLTHLGGRAGVTKIFVPIHLLHSIVSNVLILGNKIAFADIPKTVYQQYKEFGGIFRHWYAWVSFVFVAEANYAEVRTYCT